MINIPKGTKDVLPQEAYKWHYLEDNAKKTAARYNFKEIRTPVFEHTELFLRGVGETTDVVNKEMYTFLDKGERSITLKPEGTAGVARSFIENNLGGAGLPVKAYYFTPVFRYERPQAGRLREHHQFGAELYGAADASADAEVIMLAADFLSGVGVKNLSLNINSIGCETCRAEYNRALKEYLKPHLAEMCPVCQNRYEKNPLRILDCKNEACKNINLNAPKITDYLCGDCGEHFEQLKGYLKAAELDFTVNPYIVRGLDYYTRTVFEFVSNEIGSQGTVCGGGRYDMLTKILGGQQTPCVGFGMGLERLLLLMENTGIDIPKEKGVDVYIAGLGGLERKKAHELAVVLRKAGLSCEIDLMNRGIKPQFKYADKIRAKFVVVIGEEELNSGVFAVKNMSSGEQCAVAADEALDYLSKQSYD